MGAVEAAMPVGVRMATHRKNRGLSQRELGELVGRTGARARKVEAGQQEIGRVSVLRSIEGALGADLL